MELHTLEAEARTGTGKGIARKLRAAGRIPAVAYGLGLDPLSMTIDPRALTRLKGVGRGWNTPLNLVVEGAADVGLALLKSVQAHPLTDELLHADFIRVRPEDDVTVRVPLRVEGKAAGITLGGRISQSLREVELICALESIPDVVIVDVTPLQIGEQVTLQTLVLPPGCRAASRNDPSVVACVGKRGPRKAGDEAG